MQYCMVVSLEIARTTALYNRLNIYINIDLYNHIYTYFYVYNLFIVYNIYMYMYIFIYVCINNVYNVPIVLFLIQHLPLVDCW